MQQLCPCLSDHTLTRVHGWLTRRKETVVSNSISVTVTVPLGMLAAFSSGEARQVSTKAVTLSVVVGLVRIRRMSSARPGPHATLPGTLWITSRSLSAVDSVLEGHVLEPH